MHVCASDCKCGIGRKTLPGSRSLLFRFFFFLFFFFRSIMTSWIQIGVHVECLSDYASVSLIYQSALDFLECKPGNCVNSFTQRSIMHWPMHQFGCRQAHTHAIDQTYLDSKLLIAGRLWFWQWWSLAVAFQYDPVGSKIVMLSILSNGMKYQIYQRRSWSMNWRGYGNLKLKLDLSATNSFMCLCIIGSPRVFILFFVCSFLVSKKCVF